MLQSCGLLWRRCFRWFCSRLRGCVGLSAGTIPEKPGCMQMYATRGGTLQSLLVYFICMIFQNLLTISCDHSMWQSMRLCFRAFESMLQSCGRKPSRQMLQRRSPTSPVSLTSPPRNGPYFFFVFSITKATLRTTQNTGKLGGRIGTVHDGHYAT